MEDQHIFFSYSREDTDFVLKLAKDLRAAGENIWLDQLDIEPGKRWDNEIEAALKDAKKLLLVLSPTSVASENVMDEVSFALEEGRSIVPILYKPCDVPFRLRRLQFVDFSTDYQTGFQKLQEYLHNKREMAADTPVSEEAEPPTVIPAPVSDYMGKAKSNNPFPKWILGVVGLLVLAFIAFKFIPGKTGSNPGTDLLHAPNLLNKTVSEARREITAAGFSIGAIKSEENGNKPADVVIKQEPGAGASIKKGQQINLVIAVTPKTVPVTLANIIGKTYREGVNTLQQAGLSPVIRTKVSDCDKKPETIIAQFPSAGKTLQKGDEVQIDVVAPPKFAKAKKVPGEGKLHTLTNGKKLSEDAWAIKTTNIEFSLEGDECTKGSVRVSHPLGGVKVFNLKASEAQSATRFFGAGTIVLSFKSNNPKARLYVRIW